jgi:glycosyltransferase involved in cell wall biosynthesis
MVTHSLYESDHRVMRYAEALAARGDQVDVIALRKEGMPAEEIIFGVRVSRIHMRTFKEKKRLSFLGGVCAFLLKALYLVTKRHVRNRYDLFHIHSIPDFVVFVALIPRLMGARIILDIHDILPELYASKFGATSSSLGFKLMLLLERASAAFADHVIIANHIWEERLATRSVARSKCSVILNFPDGAVFRPISRHAAADRFVILFPGTLNRHQGLDVAIRAFALIRHKAPHVEFHIHGEGRSQDFLMQLVRQLGLADRVLFKPMLPVREIANIMAAANLAVVPKRKDSFGNEAFSTKILEFMSVGVPVIVSDTKIDQYYFNSSVVRFFPDGDEKQLAETMLLLITDGELRKQLASNASVFVKDFDWEVKKRDYLELVDLLVRTDRQTRSKSFVKPGRRDTALTSSVTQEP